MLDKDKFDNHIEANNDIEEQVNYEDTAEQYYEPEISEQKKSLFNRIRDYFKFGTEEVPDVVRVRYRSFLIVAASVAVGGSLIVLLMHMYLAVICCVLFGIIIALYGYSMMLSATKQGYDEIIGECIRIDYTMTSNLPGTRNMPKRFLIMDSNSRDVYALPYYKKGILVEEGDLVRIIIPKDTFKYNRGDIISLSEVWGYEIVPELNEERNKRLGIDE